MRVLRDGAEMPLLGFGVYLIADGEQTRNAVSWALEAGYRHLDTAQAYGNERSVGLALRASEIPRDEVFVTTKFVPGSGDPEAEAARSLERLGIDQLDLYLVHWPKNGPLAAWRGMERALERGLARSIGVSNYSRVELEALLAHADRPPVVNQAQFSPFHFRRGLLDACERNEVALEAYSPLTHGSELSDPTVSEIARQTGRTAAQVMIRWALERGLVVIPKSSHRERIIENSRVFDFSLDDAQMSTLDALDRTGGTDRALEHDWWTLRGRIGRRAAGLRRRVRKRVSGA